MLMSKRFSMQAVTKITKDTQMLRHCMPMPARIEDCAGGRRFTRKAAETAASSPEYFLFSSVSQAVSWSSKTRLTAL